MASDFAKIRGLSALTSAFENLESELGEPKRMAVGSPVNYGRFLEEGTSRMPPYPWLQPATDETVRKGAAIAAASSTTGEIVTNAALDIEANATRRLENTGIRPYPRTSNLAGSVTTIELE